MSVLKYLKYVRIDDHQLFQGLLSKERGRLPERFRESGRSHYSGHWRGPVRGIYQVSYLA